jgi:hypothetical protein
MSLTPKKNHNSLSFTDKSANKKQIRATTQQLQLHPKLQGKCLLHFLKILLNKGSNNLRTGKTTVFR